MIKLRNGIGNAAGSALRVVSVAFDLPTAEQVAF